MTWVEEDVSAIKRMVENQQHVVNVTLANNSSLLCNSGHLPVTSTPARDTPSVPSAVSRRHSPSDNTQAYSVAKISRRSAQPQRLSVSDITSTTCRGIESQSLVPDLCYSSGTSDKSLSTTDSSSLESWSSRNDISSNSSTSRPASNLYHFTAVSLI